MLPFDETTLWLISQVALHTEFQNQWLKTDRTFLCETNK